MRPITLQNSGIAGVTRAAGVGPRSATASGDGACIAAELIRTAFSIGPARPLQVAAASPLILDAASADENDAVATSAARAHVRVSIGNPCIVSSRFAGARVLVSRCRYNGRRGAGVKLLRQPN